MTASAWAGAVAAAHGVPDDEDDGESQEKHDHGLVFAVVQQHFQSEGLKFNSSACDIVIG